MALSDLDFLGRTVGLVGLFFICCSILHQKPKHALEELFGVYHGGLRRLRGSVFRKNQLVLGFLCAAVAVILEQFGHVLGDGSAGRVAAASPSAQVLTWLATVVGLCGVLNYLCRVFSKRHFKRVVRETVAEHRWPFDRNMALTAEIGELLGVPQDPDDTVERYVAKLKRHLALPPDEAKPRFPTRGTKLEVSFK